MFGPMAEFNLTNFQVFGMARLGIELMARKKVSKKHIFKIF